MGVLDFFRETFANHWVLWLCVCASGVVYLVFNQLVDNRARKRQLAIEAEEAMEAGETGSVNDGD